MNNTASTIIRSLAQSLRSLHLAPNSLKLYLADSKRFLIWLAEKDQLLRPSSLGNPALYQAYLQALQDQGATSSLLKRSLASLRQLGAAIASTYHVDNPTLHLSLGTPQIDYIKAFANSLKAKHLTDTTIKSYKSDIEQYLSWVVSSGFSTQLDSLINKKTFKKYTSYLTDQGNHAASTITRKTQSFGKFVTWSRENTAQLTQPNNNQVVQSSTTAPGIPPVQRTSYSWKNTFTLTNLISLAIILSLSAGFVYFGYRQLERDRVTLTQAYPGTPVTPNRKLSFQGRLENSNGTPVDPAKNMVFKLWTASSGGTELYSTGTCSIDPDADGIFNTQIGSTCGSAIPSSVFSENASVFLEVTVESEVMNPRQPIASVAYALNSETLQGIPLSSTMSALAGTIVPMNSGGEIILGENNAVLRGVSGTFTISSPNLTLTTAAGSSGNITLAPDGTGQVNVQGNTTTTNFFNVSNAQLTTGTLIGATAANNNTGFKLLDLSSGSSPTSKFSVDATGLTTVGADLYLSSGLTTYGNAVTNGTVEAIKFCTGDGETNCVTDFASLSGSAGIWSDAGTYIYPTNAEVLGNSTTAGANKLAGLYVADSAPLTLGTDNDVSFTFAGTELAVAQGNNDINFDANTLYIDGSADRVGIGTASPNNKLQVALASNEMVQLGTSGVASGLSLTNGSLTSQVSQFQIVSNTTTPISFYTGGTFNSMTNGTEKMRLSNAGGLALGNGYVGTDPGAGSMIVSGSVGIGDTTPDAPLDVVGDVYISDGLSLYESAVSDGTVEAIKFCTGDGETNCVTDFSTLSGSASIWTDGGSYIYPTNSEAITGTALGVDTTTPDANIESLATTEQLRLTHTDATHYTSFTVGASGDLTIAPSGGDLAITGDLAVNGATSADLITTTTTATLFDTTVTSLSLGGAATTLNMGAGGILGRAINIGTGTGIDTISIGTGGTGADVITLGGGAGTLEVNTGDWDIGTTGNMAGIGSITADGTISFTGTTIGLGTSNSITTLNLGTGTAGNTFNLGTNNTTKDTLNIGSALDDVIISGAGTGSLINFLNFDVSTAGLVTTPGMSSYFATNAANSVFNPVYSSAGSYIAYSPVPKYLWHDLLAFSKNWGAPTFETYDSGGASWGADTLNAAMFSQQEDQSVQIIDGTTKTAARWTWTGAAYAMPEWWVIATTYNAVASSKDFLIESSADGITWNTRHTSTANTANASPVWLKTSVNNAENYYRLTITVTNAQPLKLSAIKALTSRWGDQGQGSEYEFPYAWNSSQNIAFGASAVVANGVVTVGTNTTAATGGVYFGTDTNLYRSGANQLKTDDSLVVAGTLTFSNLAASSAVFTDTSSNLVTTGTSAMLLSTLSDETGTGVAVFGTSPTFTTNITTPLVIGGTGTTSDLYLKTTSGVGTTGADMHFLVGNNGGTEALTIFNSGTAQFSQTVNFAGGSTYFVDATGNAKFLDLIVADSGNAGITLGNGATGYFKIGSSTIYDANAAYLAFDPNSDTTADIVMTDSGSLGIGTTAPNKILEIASATLPTFRLNSTNTAVAAAGSFGELDFYANDASAGGVGISGFIKNVAVNLGVSSALTFGTRTATGGDATEVMRITDTGEVGIGTADPGYKLEVVGTTFLNGATEVGGNISTNGVLELHDLDTGNRYSLVDFHGDDTYTDYGLRVMRENTGANTNSSIIHRGTGTLQLSTVEAGAITFSTTNAERMRILSGGNVGIATTGPDRKLDILDASSPQLRLTQTDGTIYADFRVVDTGTDYLAIGVNQDPTTAGLRLYSDSRVGINAPAGSAQLNINGDVRIEASSQQLKFYDTDSATDEWSITTYNSNDLSFWENGSTTRFRFAAGGNAYTNGGNWTNGGADFAEYFNTDDLSLESGNLVALSPDSNEKVIKGNTTTRNQLLGVISTKAGFVGNNRSDITQEEMTFESDPTWKVVGLLGQVPTFVSSEHGAIRAGDPITISSQAGVGAKATQAGYIVGRAMESYDQAQPGKILVFVQPSWYDPSLALNNAGDTQLVGSSQDTFQVATPTGVTSELAAFADATIARMKVGYANIKELVADKAAIATIETSTLSPLAAGQAITITSNQDSSNISPSGFTNQEGSEPILIVDGGLDAATVSARLARLQELEVETLTAQDIVADTITARSITGLDAKLATFSAELTEPELTTITERIKDRLAKLAGDTPTAQDLPAPTSDPVLIDNLSSTLDTTLATDSATISYLSSDVVFVNDAIFVLGTITASVINPAEGTVLALAENTLVLDNYGNATINGNLTINGKLVAQDGELETLSLKGNSTSLGQLLTVFDENGTEVASINASGSANLSELTTQLITIAKAPLATDSANNNVEGTAQSNATAGQAILPAGTTELTLTNPNVNENTLIYLTPTSNTWGQIPFVQSKSGDSFTVAISTVAPEDISFNWWVIRLAE